MLLLFFLVMVEDYYFAVSIDHAHSELLVVQCEISQGVLVAIWHEYLRWWRPLLRSPGAKGRLRCHIAACLCLLVKLIDQVDWEHREGLPRHRHGPIMGATTMWSPLNFHIGV